MLNLQSGIGPANVGGFRTGMYNDGQGGIIPPQQKPAPHQRVASGYYPPQQPQQQQGLYNPQAQFQFPQPSLGFGGVGAGQQNIFANPYAIGAMNTMPMGGMPYGGGFTMPNMAFNPMLMNMGNGMMAEPLNQGQIDMVERWRQSVMQ